MPKIRPNSVLLLCFPKYFIDYMWSYEMNFLHKSSNRTQKRVLELLEIYRPNIKVRKILRPII